LGRKIDFSIVGEEFGELTVLGLSEFRPTKDTYWDCKCSRCGSIKPFPKTNLMSGNTNSCGCRFGLATKVAKKANASLTSVSLVMNNKWKNQLTKEKAEKIKKTAEEFDYRPYYNRR
jgi:hypothetical protein